MTGCNLKTLLDCPLLELGVFLLLTTGILVVVFIGIVGLLEIKGKIK